MLGRYTQFALGLLFTWPCAAQTGTEWLLPNFADRIEFTATNPGRKNVQQVVTIPLSRLPSDTNGFPGTFLLAVVADDPAHFLATQTDDLDGDGKVDDVDVLVDIPSHSSRHIHLYYSSTLHDDAPWPAKVHASHAYGYNRATAAIESESIGYRTYGGLMFDVQAHRASQQGLFNTVLGYASVVNPTKEGRDIVHYGQTLGLGGLYLTHGETVYRPPFNTPDYAHKQSSPDEPTYHILSSGPIRATIEARLPHWKIGRDEIDVRAVYEMRANEGIIRAHIWITPTHVSTTYRVGAGVLVLPHGEQAQRQGIIVNSGIQDASIGGLALALRFDPATAEDAQKLRTPDGENRVARFKKTLQAGETFEAEYELAAAWSGTGFKDPLAHLLDVMEQATPITIGPARHDSTPRPELLEREPK